MKKLLMLMAAFTLVVGIASASTIGGLCTSVGGGLASNVIYPTQIDCPDLFNPLLLSSGSLPVGYYLASVKVTGDDSFAGGLLGTNTWTFTYFDIGPGFWTLGTGADRKSTRLNSSH